MAHPPEEIAVPEDIGYVAPMKDGRIISCYCEPGHLTRDNLHEEEQEQRVIIRYSSDGGRTWTEPKHGFSYPAGIGSAIPRKHPVLVDRDGNVHVFSLRCFKVGWTTGDWSDSHIILQYNVSKDNGQTWSAVRRIDFGANYTGDLNCAMQMDNGRILVPLSYLETERTDGLFVSRVVFSDDGGETWDISNDCAIGGGQYIESGSIEPVVVQFPSGMLWMVIRTTLGYFWESFSNDGAIWTPPQQTRIVSSNAPAGVLRLRDGRIALFWNNLYGEPIRAGHVSYARQILHGAISEDEAQTWSTPKVVARQETGDPSDTHIAYPYPYQTSDGAILLLYHRTVPPDRSWANPYIKLVRVDPDWLAGS